jgi:hypothetical protein
MFAAAGGAARRFSLLLLDDDETYVGDWAADCAWPANIPGNWANAPRLPGRLRLATGALFFEPDDARVPIARCVCGTVCVCVAVCVLSDNMVFCGGLGKGQGLA